MFIDKRTQLTAGTLRIIALVLKYLFSIAVVKILDLHFVGVYNVINGYCSLLVYFLGLEFYYYANRDICSLDSSEKAVHLKTVFCFYVVAHLLAFPFIYYFFERHYKMGLIVSILIFGIHLNVEIYRILSSLRMPLIGALIFSFGNGLWVLPILISIWIGIKVGLQFIYFTTLVFLFLSIFLGVAAIGRKINIFRRGTKIELKILKHGFKVCFPILVSTLAFRGSELLGRFLLAEKTGMIASGIYSTYQVLGSTVLIITDSTIATIALPYLLEARSQGDVEFRVVKNKIRFQYLAVSLFVSCFLILFFEEWANFISKPEMLNYRNGFYCVVIGYCCLSVSSYYQLVLYAQRNDRAVFWINFLSAIFMVLITYISILVFDYGILGVSTVFLVWGSLQMVAKMRLANFVARRSANRSFNYLI